MSVPIKDRTAIGGIGSTPFAKSLPQSELRLACEAILSALQDAGVDPAEVDGLSSYTMEPFIEVEVARNLGFRDVTWFSQVGYGGGAGCGVVGNAAMAVATGQCQVAVAWRARKRGAAASRPWSQVSRRVAGAAAWSRPWGLLRPVDEIAMLAQRYMHEYGLTREQLARAALAFRKHANRNPAAVMHDRPLTLEQYLGARWISEPLCLYDNCLESDGAVALVIVPIERARDLPHPPVVVHAYAQGFNAEHQTMTNYFRDDPLEGPAWACSKLLWRNADVGPENIDVAQLYDAFSPLIPLSLEGYGFCKRGEAGAFMEEGGIEWPDGPLPVNTSGGGMSEAYVHGINLISEAARQIRGTSACQVEGAEWSMVTSGEGVPTSALLLRRDR